MSQTETSVRIIQMTVRIGGRCLGRSAQKEPCRPSGLHRVRVGNLGSAIERTTVRGTRTRTLGDANGCLMLFFESAIDTAESAWSAIGRTDHRRELGIFRRERSLLSTVPPTRRVCTNFDLYRLPRLDCTAGAYKM